MGTELEVNVQDLPISSDIRVDVLCDYCQSNIVSKQYKKYIKQREVIPKDCCLGCRKLKSAEVMMVKHGVSNSFELESVREKKREANMIHSIESCKRDFESRGYVLLEDEYINNETHMRYICSKHEEQGVQTIMLGKLLIGRGCKYCGKESMAKKQRLTYNEVKNFVEVRYGEIHRVNLISKKYSGYTTKLTMEDNDGYKYNYSFAAIKAAYENNSELSKFYNGNKYTLHNISLWVDKLDIGYSLMGGNYTRNTSILNFICDKGHEFQMMWSQFQFGARCPICNSSKGESKIREVLNRLGIDHLNEHSFSDCRNKKPLPFDFYIPSIQAVIEYDGEQHFEAIEFFGGQSKLKYQQQNDKIKNQYCKDNSIPLLRIPYWDFDNIDQILEEWLGKYNLIKSKVTGQAV